MLLFFVFLLITSRGKKVSIFMGTWGLLFVLGFWLGFFGGTGDVLSVCLDFKF